MAPRTGLWVNSRVDAADARLGVGALLAGAGGIANQAGIILDSGNVLGVTAGPGANDVQVAAGCAVIPRTGVVGPYLVGNDATVTVTLPAPPSTDKRIDSVYIGQPDVDAGDPDSVEVITYVSGAVSATPTAPAVPAYALRLADVMRTAGDTAITAAMITNFRTHSVPRRAVGWIDAASNLPTVRTGSVNGEINWADAEGTHYRLASGSWEPLVNLRLTGIDAGLVGSPPAVSTGLFKVQAGSVVVTTAADGTFNFTYPVAFPGGIITVLVAQGDNANAPFFIEPIQASLTTSTFYGTSQDKGGIGLNAKTIRLNWLAIGW